MTGQSRSIVMAVGLLGIFAVVVSNSQTVKGYITDEQRLKMEQARVDNEVERVLPIFEQQCKAELGIPENDSLGYHFTECKDAQAKLQNHSLTP
jgi:hypothetical protein